MPPQPELWSFRMRIRQVFWTAAPALLFAAVWSSAAVGDTRVFTEHCAKCHQRAASVARELKGDTLEERTAALDKFLSTHHAEDPKVRAAVIDYLIGLSTQ